MEMMPAMIAMMATRGVMAEVQVAIAKGKAPRSSAA
jgi:hypothetical protein